LGQLAEIGFCLENSYRDHDLSCLTILLSLGRWAGDYQRVGRAEKVPAARVVGTVYRGGYEGLGAAWGEFCGWIEAEGLSVQDRLWECYLAGSESGSDPDQWRTELSRPLAP
jgi:hypothetical protein